MSRPWQRSGSFVVVPNRPGPLIEEKQRNPDEVGVVLDELVGKPTIEKPGWFDAAFLASGLALLTWGVLASGPSWALVVGWLALAIGVIMPLRSLWKYLGETRTATRRKRMQRLGTVLDATTPSAMSLVNAYSRLVDIADPSHGPWATEALEAGHSAVLEVAGLLEARAPRGAMEVEYVTTRAAALHLLVESAERMIANIEQHRRTEAASRRSHEEDMRAALVWARDELDRATGTGSLREIERVMRLMRQEGEADDAP